MCMHDSTLECRPSLSPSQIADLRLAASPMSGPKRRAFEAEMTLKYCGGSPLLAETLLLQVVRMMFRARWEIVEPRYREAKFRAPSADRCAEIARSIVADYDRMQRDAEDEGVSGLDKFYAAFHSELRAEVKACGDEWLQLMNQLRETPADNPEKLSDQLGKLLENNAKWLVIGGREFTLTVGEFV
jgi:hypothetical protein